MHQYPHKDREPLTPTPKPNYAPEFNAAYNAAVLEELRSINANLAALLYNGAKFTVKAPKPPKEPKVVEPKVKKSLKGRPRGTRKMTIENQVAEILKTAPTDLTSMQIIDQYMTIDDTANPNSVFVQIGKFVKQGKVTRPTTRTYKWVTE